MHTIGQVSEMYNLPISTLRYYDKEGFFPNLMRKGNIRYFCHGIVGSIINRLLIYFSVSSIGKYIVFKG